MSYKRGCLGSCTNSNISKSKIASKVSSKVSSNMSSRVSSRVSSNVNYKVSYKIGIKEGSIFQNPFKSKKGQVTIFIIIGIALLFAFAGVMYVTKIIKKDALETEGASAIEDVPSQFRPVRLYTEDCLRE
ncbi:MAG: hypothetical protein ABIH82_01255, partial [Candidatus Woesearchaeota archaeon]